MIARLERTQNNTQQNMEQTQLKNGSNNQQQQNRRLRTDSSLSHWGGA